MRQPDHEYEERSFGDIQRAIDFENSMNSLHLLRKTPQADGLHRADRLHYAHSG